MTTRSFALRPDGLAVPGAETAAWWQTPTLAAAAITASVSLLIAVIGAVVQSIRARKDRRRERFAEAFAAVAAYWEFPYVVRRRRHDQPAAERVRISEALRAVQQQITFHEALLRPEARLAGEKYRELVATTRRVIGPQIREAWLADPITSDEEMNIDIVSRAGLETAAEAYITAVSDHLSMVPAPLLRTARAVRRHRTTGPA